MIKKNTTILYIISFLQGMVFYYPISTIFRQSRGLSIEQVLLLQSILSLIIVVSEVPLGYIADRVGYKKMLVFSNVTLLISKIVFYKSTSFSLFLVESILLGVSISSSSGCDIALLYESSNKQQGEKVFGAYNSIGNLGLLISSVVSTFLISVSLDLTVIVSIVPHALCAFMSLFLADVKRKSKCTQSKSNLNKIGIKNHIGDIKPIVIFVFFTACILQVVHSTTVFLNQIQYENIGIDFKLYGIIAAFIQLLCIFESQTYKLTNKFGKFKIFIFLLIMLNLGFVILIYNNSAVLSIISITLISVSFSMCNPIIYDIQNKFIESNRATILSIYSMISNIMTFIGNLIIGRCADISLIFSFKICFLIVIFSSIGCCIFLLKNEKYLEEIRDINKFREA